MANNVVQMAIDRADKGNAEYELQVWTIGGDVHIGAVINFENDILELANDVFVAAQHVTSVDIQWR